MMGYFIEYKYEVLFGIGRLEKTLINLLVSPLLLALGTHSYPHKSRDCHLRVPLILASVSSIKIEFFKCSFEKQQR